MGRYEAAPASSTQSAFPRRAAIRTAVQVGIPAFVGLLVILPLIIQAIVDGFGQHLPAELYGWLLGAAAVITAASATLARISAIPGVIDWTRRYLSWLAPDDKKPSA
jgi:hypothetical protein